MNILISGATGLIGSALSEYLAANGHSVYPLVRQKSSSLPFCWDPDTDHIKLSETTGIDAVIHLAGENIATGRWTKTKKERILKSREKGTRLLANSLATRSPKPQVLISSSAIGYYGNTGEREVDELSPAGNDYLSEVCQRWEAATSAARKAGIRTAHIRSGIVLSQFGGVLKKMLLPFKLGMGGAIGSGKQYISWISLEELLKMIEFILVSQQPPA